MALLVTLVVGAYGATELYAAVVSARAQAASLQRTLARDAARAVTVALKSIDDHISAVTTLPWGVVPTLTLNVRHDEYARLLRLVPAIESISYLDSSGVERLHVSRREPDRFDAGVPSAEGPSPSQPAAPTELVYGSGYEPVLVLRRSYDDGGDRTVVRLTLRTIAEQLNDLLTHPQANVYVLDESGVVVLHANPANMLMRQLVVLPPARQGDVVAQAGVGEGGAEVVRSVVALADPPWRIVVEQPRSVLAQPVNETLVRGGVFLAISLVGALLAALVVAGRLTRPVRALHSGAAELAAGDLAARINIQTGDELEELAGQFNRMASSLQLSHSELEQKVADKTRDLERANRHKSEFLAHMSHELRTPLNAILGFADVLREHMAGPLNDEQREYVTDIHASGLHLLALINDVLDLTKIEAGQMALEPTVIDVPEVVAAAAALLRQRCLHQGLTLNIELQPEVGMWYADPRRIKQVLLNLLSNAVKFTPGGGHITVRGRMDEARGLIIEVQDDGVGIALHDQDMVFEAFRQVGQVDHPAGGEGTGLGLALVRRLVHQHGGEVALISRPGEGSTFAFNIPRQPAPAAA